MFYYVNILWHTINRFRLTKFQNNALSVRLSPIKLIVTFFRFLRLKDAQLFLFLLLFFSLIEALLCNYQTEELRCHFLKKKFQRQSKHNECFCKSKIFYSTMKSTF